jgi:ATP-dependent DNA ligase
MEQYEEYVSEGYEGIIVRNLFQSYVRTRSRFMLKFKPKKFDIYEIIDVVEAKTLGGEEKGMVGSFWCVGEDGERFKVGAGTIKHQKRKEIWTEHISNNSIIGRFCNVQYQHLTSANGVPRFGLALDVVG